MVRKWLSKEDGSVFYAFCSSTSLHGLDQVRPESRRPVQLLWSLCSIAGAAATAVVMAAIVRSHALQEAGSKMGIPDHQHLVMSRIKVSHINSWRKESSQ